VSRIFIAGHRGMVGSAIGRALRARGVQDLVTRGHAELDLVDQGQVRAFFATEKVDHVILAAAKVGGIHANDTYPAEFIYENLMLEANVIHEAWRAGVRRLLFLGSSCIYPRMAPQPMPEQALLTGPLEPTNEPYAIAKIAGIKLCESYNRQYGTDYRSVMPTNLYGPGDNYHPENSHVIPALLRRFHEARQAGAERVVVWGTGTPRREFLYVDDMAEACLHVMDLDAAAYAANTQPMLSHINVGSGEDVTILELARAVARVVGFAGRIETDPSKPDGTPRKLMDVGRLRALGWKPRVGLEEGLARAYRDFLGSATRR
jgi:GDP-L-fucose synthase